MYLPTCLILIYQINHCIPFYARKIQFRFQSLATALTSESSFSVLELYQKCYSNLQNIISTESQPILVETLREVQTSIEWQLNHYKNALINSPTPDSQGELCSEARKFKKMKGGDRLFQVFLEKFKIEKQSCSGSLRKEALLATIRTSSVGASLSDIAGLDHVKSVLRKSVLLPLQCPALFIGRQTWNHILLYGPPGTGKSKIAAAVANDSHLALFSISSADLLSKWVGESEKTIKDLFEVARSSEKTSIIFIDEIDSMCRKRNDSEGDHSRRVKNQLLIEMDNNLNSDKRCILICATNCPWDLDIAFIRRFQCRVFLPLPDKAARLKILRDQCKGVGTNMSDDEWQTIATLTEGYSGADLTNLVVFAIQEPLEEFEYNQPSDSIDQHKWQAWTSNESPAQVPPPVKAHDDVLLGPHWWGGLKCHPSIAVSLTLPNATIRYATVCDANAPKVEIRDVKFDDFKKALRATPKSVTNAKLGKFHVFMEQTG